MTVKIARLQARPDCRKEQEMKILTICAFEVLVAFHAQAEMLTFPCSFTTQADPSGVTKLETPLTLTFLVDTNTGAAYVMGNNGANPVQRVGGAGLTFIETTGSGTVQVTAMTRGGQATHSRHTSIAGQMFPSQLYGTCPVK